MSAVTSTDLIIQSYERLAAGRIADAIAIADTITDCNSALADTAIALAESAAATQQNDAFVAYLRLADRCRPEELTPALRLLAYWAAVDPQQAVSWAKDLLIRKLNDNQELLKILRSIEAQERPQLAFDALMLVAEQIVGAGSTFNPYFSSLCMLFSRIFNGYVPLARGAAETLALSLALRADAPDWRWLITSLSFIGGHAALPVAAAAVAAVLRREAQLPPAPVDPVDVALLAQEGRIHLGPLLSPEAAAAIVAQAQRTPCYPAFFPFLNKVSTTWSAARRESVYASYDPTWVLDQPGVLEAANHPRVLGLAESYLGSPPILYSSNLWWTFPNGELGATHYFHRDIEDCRFISLFIPMTRVNDDCGPFVFVRGSHTPQELSRRLMASGHDGDVTRFFVSNAYGGDELISSCCEDLIERWLNGPGEATLCDNYGLHRGEPPSGGERLLLWIRYGYGTNLNMLSHPPLRRPFAHIAGRVPDTPRARWTNQLFFN